MFCQGDPFRPFLGGKGSDGAGYEDHDDRAVQDTFIQQPYGISVGRITQDNIVAHQNSRQGGGRLGIGKSENKHAFFIPEAEAFLGYPCCNKFCEGGNHRHHHGHQDGPGISECPVIDQHPHPYQKERYKDGVANKIDPVHQGRGQGDQAV